MCCWIITVADNLAYWICLSWYCITFADNLKPNTEETKEEKNTVVQI